MADKSTSGMTRPGAKSPTTKDRRAEARQRLLLAVDVPDLQSARRLVETAAASVGGIKIGKELFTRCGPDAIEALAAFGLPVFLDLKFHDIPQTVARAVEAAAQHGVRWLSLHTSGGASMLEAAARARDALPHDQRPLLLGVTVLTSLDVDDVEEVVDRALLAERCGLDGAIASPQELVHLRAACGDGFLLVTPGVRPEGATSNDQARVATPGTAIRDGADLLVVGRPIHAAGDPARAAASIVDEIARALADRAAWSGTTAAEHRALVHESADSITAKRLLRMLRESGAFLEGHFILSSGLHSDRYVQCAQMLQYPHRARRAGIWLAERMRRYQPETVISVALGGLVIGQEVAAALGVRALFAERDGSGVLRLRRGFDLRPGERVAIVDDVCTRGGSIAECSALVLEQNAAIVATGAIIDRSGGNRSFEHPFEALLEIEAKALAVADCPACAAGDVAVKPGSRRT
jgi:orotidine-5'-phosphate decarboxylase